jgi:hypothetical protein
MTRDPPVEDDIHGAPVDDHHEEIPVVLVEEDSEVDHVHELVEEADPDDDCEAEDEEWDADDEECDADDDDDDDGSTVDDDSIVGSTFNSVGREVNKVESQSNRREDPVGVVMHSPLEVMAASYPHDNGSPSHPTTLHTQCQIPLEDNRNLREAVNASG